MPDPLLKTPVTSPALPNGARYNEVRQKSSHNAFENSDETIFEQITLSNIHSLEVDLHKGKLGVDLDGDWYIYHRDILYPKTDADTFSLFLDKCKRMHNSKNDHEVFTMFLDIHDNFTDEANHTAGRLDQLIESYLPGIVYTPGAFAGTSKTLRAAAQAGNWETIDNLKGKFIFVLTGANIDDEQSVLKQYVDNGASALTRKAFIAPETGRIESVASDPSVVFYNLAWGNRALARKIFEWNFVSRVFPDTILLPVSELPMKRAMLELLCETRRSLKPS